MFRQPGRYLRTYVFPAVTYLAIAGSAPAMTPGTDPACRAENTTLAQVVALEQIYVYNRFGAFNPGGMLYALRRDVVASSGDGEEVAGFEDGDPIPLAPDATADAALAGNVRLRADKRPRPVVLRVNEGDCLRIVFTNLLSPIEDGEETFRDPRTGIPMSIESDEPATRAASIHVSGMELSGSIASDGTNVGFNASSLAQPGETRVYTLRARKEGAYLLYSMGAAAGGEGDGGQLGLGLFGSVNVEPKGSIWYRSQVTGNQLAATVTGQSAKGTPEIDYTAKLDGVPVLGMAMPITDPDATEEIVHSDLNAVVDPVEGEDCGNVTGPGNSCGQPFREFTVIFHDELTAVQAFPELADEDNPISALKDGMGINYGAAGLGAMVLANRKGVGPAKDCVECKLEEFFLTSWAMGDPALVLERDGDMKAVRALYPDDPSNVHHSYLGDAVRFRNLHAGPKETHVFHLHAHQWVQDWQDDDSVYLDSQTISPGASFTYSVHYGGSGNRNLTPGDSIFHCHLYPHFAQGMWELWRTHDVFEDGSDARKLPDAEIAGGTPNPAVVPLPHAPLPPMPTPVFEGYPFYIAGVPGHRPPQPPLDIDPSAYAGADTAATLMRHVVLGGERETGVEPFGHEADGQPKDLEKKYFDTTLAENDPMGQTNRIAARVRSQNANPNLFALAAKLTKAWIRKLPLDGTPSEQTAMDFHAGTAPGAVVVPSSDYGVPEKGYPTCDPAGNCGTPAAPLVFRVNGLAPKPGAPFADPCTPRYYLGSKTGDHNDPANWYDLPPERRYNATYLQFDMPVNKHGWHDPQARIITLEHDAAAVMNHERAPEPFFFRANSGECVVFEATNLIPSNLNLDDFQVFSPTDTIGQHIHLVKFDVTSSDGSGNGWNYEDGTFSPDELRERIIANNAYKGVAELKPLTHRLFLPGGALDTPEFRDKGLCPATLPADPILAERALEEHPWCGAQSTLQRWWADPLLNYVGKDRTIRTVFTHDHFGPSSHQQHGFYAALVIEPNGSSWKSLAGREFGGQDAAGAPIRLRDDGGPTSAAAMIVDKAEPGKTPESRREYNLAVADFALLYTAPPENKAVSAPGRLDHDLPDMVENASMPRPEGISVSDPGGQLLNYRNEPVPLRVGSENAEGRWSLRTYDAQSSDVAACKASLEAAFLVNGAPQPDTRLAECRDGPWTPQAQQVCEARVVQALCDTSDLSNVFSSHAHANQDASEAADVAADALVYDTRKIFNEVYLNRSCADTADLNCVEPAGLRRDGDPATPLLAAREGDRVQLRLIQGAQEENHIFFMNGARWLAEPGSVNSGWRAAQAVGISEHFEFNLDVEDPAPQATKDHLYGTTATDNLWDGQWGLMRVVGSQTAMPALASLPGHGTDTLINVDQSTCSPSVPRRTFKVEAWRMKDLLAGGKLRYHEKRDIADPNARIFVLAGMTTQKAKPATGSRPAEVVRLKRAQSDAALIAGGKKQPEPLILRARAGECIEVELTNRLGAVPEDLTDPGTWSWNMMPPITYGLNFNQIRQSNAVGLHAQLVSGNATLHDGSFAGGNVSSLAYPCDASKGEEFCASDEGATLPDDKYPWDNRVTYRWYAGEWKKGPDDPQATLTPIEFGAAALQDFGDPIKGSSHGRIGALVVEPANAEWQTDCDRIRATDAPEAEKAACLNAAATVTVGTDSFREFVLMYQNDASLRYRGEALANLRNGDDAEDSGQKAFNYRTEPFWTRLDANPAADPESMMDYDYSNVLSSTHAAQGDPSTPVFTTAAGMPVRFRLIEPAGHPRNGAFTLSGHDWVEYPWAEGSTVQKADPRAQNRFGVVNGIGPGRHMNVLLESAGGAEKIAGDFLYRTPLGFAFGGGQWGIMRVYDPADCDANGLILDPNTGRRQVCR